MIKKNDTQLLLQEYVNLGDILVFRELAAHTHNKPGVYTVPANIIYFNI